jgi:phospholipid/cholesterol/gamma-HCH transport system permease protein
VVGWRRFILPSRECRRAGHERVMYAAIERIGETSIRTVKSFYETLAFSSLVFFKIFDRKSYNSAMRMVLVNQIYFTSVQVLPLFIAVSILFGSPIVGITLQVLKHFGLADRMGSVLMGFVVTELSPFMTVLLIALRSSSAINAEIAVMKVNRELKTLDVFGIDVLDYLFLPRIINGILSIVCLSSLFSILALASGALFSRYLFDMSVNDYTTLLFLSADFSDLFILFIKCILLGFFITLIPIRFGLRATHELTSIPISVLNGMVKVFIAIVIIEVLSLLLRFI